MKKGKLRRLTLHRETLRRLDSDQLRNVVGATVLTTCPPCDPDSNDCDPQGTSTLSCTQFVCLL